MDILDIVKDSAEFSWLGSKQGRVSDDYGQDKKTRYGYLLLSCYTLLHHLDTIWSEQRREGRLSEQCN